MGYMYKHIKQVGMSLIELMVAITIFALITISVFTMYISTTRNFNQDENIARMLENGRYALDFIVRDMTMAGFWGEMLTPQGITTAMSLGNDCGMNLSTFINPILYYVNGGTVMGSFNPFSATSCNGVSGLIGGTLKTGSNALAIKRVDYSSMTNSETTAGDVYLNTNGTTGSLVEKGGGDTSYNYWKYTPVLYAIRSEVDPDNGSRTIPYLCRLELWSESSDPTPRTSGSALAMNAASSTCLAEGIEYLHVEFGVDTDEDLVANQYISNITTTQARQAVTARVYLMVRSAIPDANPNYVNDKTYTLGSYSVNSGNPFNDRYYRRVLSTTVSLRNPRIYLQINPP